MANIYSWMIDSLECIPLIDGKTNVVSVVYWRISATDGKNIAGSYGAQQLTYAAESPFIAYESLTEATVIGWVQDSMGVKRITAIQSNLDNQIANLANPLVITPPLPWTIA